MSRLDELKELDWGLVLSGGGGKGAFQIGVWQVLSQTGFFDKVKAIAGSSIGAFNLALMAYGDYKMAHDIWYHMKQSIFMDADAYKVKYTQGLFKRGRLVELIDDYINLERVSKSKKELFVSATECDKLGNSCKKIEYFKINGKSPEEIKEILLASSAFPVVYDAVNVDGIVYRDGGMKDNLPIKPLYDAGYRNIIVVPLSNVVEIDIAQFPAVNFLTIAPTKNLGGLLDGTFNFTEEGARKRMIQGINDAVAVFLNL